MENATVTLNSPIKNAKKVKHEISDKFPLALQRRIKARIARSTREEIETFGRNLLRTLYGDIRVHGEIPTGRIVLVANHVHLFDSIAIKALDKRFFKYETRREVIFVSKIEHQEEPMLTPVFEKFPTVFIDREQIKKSLTLQKKFLKEAKEVIENDAVFAIFPEGTRKGMKKGVDLHSGAIDVARLYGADILPVRFVGDFKFHFIDYLKSVLFLVPYTHIDIVIGNTINPKQLLNGRTKDEAINFLMRDVVMNLQVPEEGIQKTKCL